MSLSNPIISDLIVDTYRQDRLTAAAMDRLLARAHRSPRANARALALIGRRTGFARALFRERTIRRGRPLTRPVEAQ